MLIKGFSNFRAVFICFFTSALILTTNAGRCQSNLVLLVSEPGDYIGQGQPYATTEPVYIRSSNINSLLEMEALGFFFSVNGSNNAPLTVGTYPNVGNASWQRSIPGLTIWGDGRGCDNICGSFQVYELATDADNNVTRLWMSFTQQCECWSARLTGEIRYHSELAPPAPQPKILHVPAEYPSIQTAINAAGVIVADTVLVTNGTYFENLDFGGKAVTVTSVNGPQVTIIDGSRAGPVFNFHKGEGAGSVIKGFTIQNGRADWGAGITLQWASPTILNNIFKDNAQGAGGFGAGIGGNGASPTIENNLFQNNTADSQLLSGAVSFVNNSSPIIAYNVFLNNSCRAINLTLPEGNTPVVINNTIVGNSVGIRVDARVNTSSQVYYNNILFGNDVGLQVDFGNGYDGPTWGNNLVFGGLTTYAGISEQTGIRGNISAKPWFTCEPGGDFHLLAGSPGIDAGTNSTQIQFTGDFDSNPRIVAGISNNAPMIDMGAYEFDPANPPVPCSYINCQDNMVVYTGAGQNSVTVNFPTPTATPSATVICSPPSGSAFHGGTNVVTCTATYGTNSVSCSFKIVVVVAPAINRQPQSLSVAAGNTISLAVGVTGTPPFNYQWLYQGNIISGANSQKLTITNAQSANDGVYSVMVSNGAGATNSNFAQVQVLPAKPVISVNPASVTVFAGSKASFSVNAAGSEPFRYQWWHNGMLLRGATNAQLILTNPQVTDAGSYWAVVLNSLGTANSLVAKLVVRPSAPHFVIQPTSTQALAGATVTLTSQAAGSDWIFYQWYFQDRPLRNQNRPQLVLPAVTPALAGRYHVMAINLFGLATSTKAQLTVNVPPQPLHALANQIVQAGQNVTLDFPVRGDGPLNYSWQWNGLPISWTNAVLVITNIQADMAGYLQVTVSNAYGTTSSVAKVSIVLPPSQLVVWGDDINGQTNVPAGLNNVIAAAGGDYHTIAIRNNGAFAAWGTDSNGQTGSPAHQRPFVFIASGGRHNLALDNAGFIYAWGDNASGQCVVPAAAAKQPLTLAAGEAHSLVLLADGSVVAWGDGAYGQTNLPDVLTTGYYYWDWWENRTVWWPNPYWHPAVAIAAGHNHNLAILDDNTVTGWGDNSYGQLNIPPDLTNAVAIAGGGLHSVALRADGTVTVWGNNSFGQTEVPPGLTNVVAIAAGDFHTIALMASGKVVGWGNDVAGQTDIPTAVTNAVGIASGYYHSMALLPPRK